MSAKTKQADKPRAYLLKGDDEIQKKQRLEKLLTSLVSPDFADFDLEQLEGDSATSDKIMAGLNVPPFASDQRVVLVRYANKIPQPEQEKLASVLSTTPESACLVMVNPAAEKVDGKPRKGSEVIGDLSRAVRKVGEVIDFAKMRTGDAVTFAKSIFAEAGKRIDPTVVSAFVQRVGADSSVIASEARKLIDYSGDSKIITTADVAAVTCETPEEKIFKLTDAIAAKNQSDALRLLGELFEAGDDPDADAPKTLANIARQFRLLWQVKLLLETGATTFRKDTVPDRVKAQLPSSPNVLDILARQNWMEDRLKRQARPFTHEELTRCFNAIARTDLMLKGIEGSIEDPRAVMELLVIELARGGRR